MTLGSTAAKLTLAIALAAPMGLAANASAYAQERRSALETLLGGSFFPFARSFPPPSKRCLRAAEKLRRKRDDNILNPQDALELRRIGCNGAATYR